MSDSPANQIDNFVYKTIELKDKDLIEECVITELKRASRYEIIVQVFNSKGAGPTSEPVYVKTLEFGECNNVANLFCHFSLIIIDDHLCHFRSLCL